MKWIANLVRWIKSFFKRDVVISSKNKPKWVVIPLIYEKWKHPANKNDKHYRAIFRSSTSRRVGKTKFKTAGMALAFAERFNQRLCIGRKQSDASTQ